MSGIVERLRNRARYQTAEDPFKLLETAAYEIERLQRELATARRKAFTEAAEIAEAHASQCRSKLNKKRSDHDLAVFESAMSEADSITLAIRARAEG